MAFSTYILCKKYKTSLKNKEHTRLANIRYVSRSQMVTIQILDFANTRVFLSLFTDFTCEAHSYFSWFLLDAGCAPIYTWWIYIQSMIQLERPRICSTMTQPKPISWFMATALLYWISFRAHLYSLSIACRTTRWEFIIFLLRTTKFNFMSSKFSIDSSRISEIYSGTFVAAAVSFMRKWNDWWWSRTESKYWIGS